jgi:nucleoside 2-deoxyribosyltransferase
MTSFAPRPRCYVASPLGFSEGGRHYYAEILLPALSTVVEPVDPWSLTADEEFANAMGSGREREVALQAGHRNAEAIRSCSLVVAYLEGQELDAGTVAEVGYAAGLGLTCFGLRTDNRQTGERGATVNLQVETFILDSGGRIANSLDQLLHDLADAVGQIPPAAAQTETASA